MSRSIMALAAALLAAGLTPALADGPASTGPSRPTPNFYNSPTDEYVPPARMAPRTQRAPQTQRTARRAPGVGQGGTSLTAFIRALPSTVPPSLSTPAPLSSAPAYSYSYLPEQRTLYYVAPATPAATYRSPDFDGAPCPSRPSQAMAPLFECTLR